MRNTLILLLALFAGTAFAQAPVIDSMLIDEREGVLSVYGDFGTAQGKVWCDSVELPVLSWSASLVTATIPDTGKGSAGGVVVEDNLGVSSVKFISLWKGSVSNIHYTSGWREYYCLKRFEFSMRIELLSLIQTSKDRTTKVNSLSNQYALESSSSPYDPSYGKDVGQKLDARVYVNNSDTSHTLGFNCMAEFSQTQKKIIFRVNNIRGLIGDVYYTKDNTYFERKYEHAIIDYIAEVDLDSFYNIIKYYKETKDSYYTYEEFSKVDSQNFIPYKAISRYYHPFQIAPDDNSTNLGNNDILLKWDPLEYMDAYHIQLSKDSLINGQRVGQAQQAVAYIVDTIVSSLDFALPHLEKNTKYYWRVCGVNTEGESRWSEVWSFTTGTSTDVKAEASREELRIYPNPATSELTVVTPEPTRLLLYDVTGKIIKSEQTLSNETQWDVSLLPNGTYILGTSGGQMQVVQIVK